MNDLNVKEVSDICVSCGMCCDGTLFRRAKIKDKEDKIVAESSNLKIIKFENKDYFKLPCTHFTNCCAIYHKTRPAICGNFFCKPLQMANKGEISLEDATNQISTLLNLKKELILLAAIFNKFNRMDIIQIFDQIEMILEKSNPKELKKYGYLILKFVQFKKAKQNFNYTNQSDFAIIE